MESSSSTIDLVWGVWGIEKPETEYEFHSTRKWRLDFAWPDRLIAAEIEGGIWNQGRHTRSEGFIGDMEKYNEATRLGWKVFRFQPKDLRSGKAQTFIQTVFKKEKEKLKCQSQNPEKKN